MKNFVSVSTGAARYQDLSLNPQKLAGQCAKLKCCMNYEVDAYVEAGKRLPSREITLQTQDAEFYFFKADILSGMVTYSSDKNIAANLTTISARRAFEIISMNRRNEKPEKLTESEQERNKPADLVEQESLTRFDKRKKNKPGNRRDRNDNKNNEPNNLRTGKENKQENRQENNSRKNNESFKNRENRNNSPEPSPVENPGKGEQTKTDSRQQKNQTPQPENKQDAPVTAQKNESGNPTKTQNATGERPQKRNKQRRYNRPKNENQAGQNGQNANAPKENNPKPVADKQ